MNQMRRRFDLYLTNDFRDGRAVFGEKPRLRGTPKQILEEISDFRRISSGCDITTRVIDPKTGARVNVNDWR